MIRRRKPSRPTNEVAREIVVEMHSNRHWESAIFALDAPLRSTCPGFDSGTSSLTAFRVVSLLVGELLDVELLSGKAWHQLKFSGRGSWRRYIRNSWGRLLENQGVIDGLRPIVDEVKRRLVAVEELTNASNERVRGLSVGGVREIALLQAWSGKVRHEGQRAACGAVFGFSNACFRVANALEACIALLLRAEPGYDANADRLRAIDAASKAVACLGDYQRESRGYYDPVLGALTALIRLADKNAR